MTENTSRTEATASASENEEKNLVQEEVDARSIYVGNVDYQTTPEQLEEFFHVVGVIERVTILFDRFSGLPKGYAYVEFEKPESVARAVEELHGKDFRNREIRVSEKRTNLPGFRKRGNGFRGGRGRGRGFRGNFRGRGGRGSYRGGRGGYNNHTNDDGNGNGDGNGKTEETEASTD